jgi:hypothetical protein
VSARDEEDELAGLVNLLKIVKGHAIFSHSHASNPDHLLTWAQRQSRPHSDLDACQFRLEVNVISTRWFEFNQRSSCRNKTESRKFDQLNRCRKPVARLENLVLDHLDNHLVDDLGPQLMLWCEIGQRTQLTGRLRS